jgi:8-oxo-dGTP pyrophosphatase MutT (NUDIX family)
MNLFQTLPALRHHPRLKDKRISLVGVSTIPRDGTSCYFEISKPKYWAKRDDGSTVIGIGGIGGTIEQGETVVACLRREVEEELGARVQLENSPQTHLIHNWQIVDRVELKPSKKRATPLMVILIPPRLGGPDTPDHLAIICFHTRLRGTPAPHDLFGLLRVDDHTLDSFFARDEWRLNEAQTHQGLSVVLNGQPPPDPILHPILTARAYQLLVRAGYEGA